MEGGKEKDSDRRIVGVLPTPSHLSFAFSSLPPSLHCSWCDLFDPEDLSVLVFFKDVKAYWMKGPSLPTTTITLPMLLSLPLHR